MNERVVRNTGGMARRPYQGASPAYAELGVALCLLFLPGRGVAQEERVVPPQESEQGQSQEEWSRAWWQWAGSFKDDESPVADRTGELCASRQNGPVWFLAGTYGTHRTVRTCTVPKGKYLFFPLIDYVSRAQPGYRLGCESVKASARSAMERAGMLVLEIDGRRVGKLEHYRQATGKCFEMGAAGQPGYKVYPAAADGYYIMLRPLKPGRHTLNFGGMTPGMSQAVTYSLVVE